MKVKYVYSCRSIETKGKKNNMQKIIYFIKILFFWIVLSPFFTGISGICKNKISYGSNQGKQVFFYNYGTSYVRVH